MAITKTWDTSVSVDAQRSKVTYEGLSTDSKPTTDVGVNDEFRELDTGKWYYFDGSAWQEGVGGGSSGSGGVVVKITDLDPQSATLFYAQASILAGEIAEIIEAGTPCVVEIDLTLIGISKKFYVNIQELNYADNNLADVVGYCTFVANNSTTSYCIRIYTEQIGTRNAELWLENI